MKAARLSQSLALVGGYAALPHVILVVTHTGLTLADLGRFEGGGWHARVDEAPDVVTSGTLKVPAAATWYAATYDLRPSAIAGWYEVVVRADAPSLSAIRADDHLAEIAPWHRRAASARTRVYVDVGSWDDAAVTARTVRWWSIWSLAELQAFDSVVVAGAAVDRCLAARAAEVVDGVTYRIEHLPVQRSKQPHIRIHYYAGQHLGSSTWFASPAGRDVLLRIAADLKARGGVEFWSGNDVVRKLLEGKFAGEMERPKLAGLDKFESMKSVAFIYSSKAVPADAVLQELLGLSVQDITAMREDEDVRQFVSRGAIRDAKYGGTYDVYLYDVRQARALAAALRADGFEDVDEPVLIELDGVANVVRPKAGRPRAEPSLNAEEHADRKRQQNRDRMRATRATKAAMKSARDGFARRAA